MYLSQNLVSAYLIFLSMLIFLCIHTQNHFTLLVQDFRLQKNYHSQFSVPGLWEIHRNLKQQKKIQFLLVLFQKIPFLYFFLHKSCIWWTLGHAMNIFSYCHFYDASKECFWPKKKKEKIMHGFKSAINLMKARKMLIFSATKAQFL